MHACIPVEGWTSSSCHPFGNPKNKEKGFIMVPADEYLQAAECLRGLSDFSQGQQGSGFAGYVQQCRDQRAALQEVGIPP